MLRRYPATTARAVTLAALTGGAAFALLMWRTDGGFFRHIIIYNVNRFSLSYCAILSFLALSLYLPLLGLVIAAVFIRWRTLAREFGCALLWQRIGDNQHVAVSALLTLYLCATGALTVLAGKHGASYNYYIEFMCVWCVWIGWLCRAQGTAKSPDQIPAAVFAKSWLPAILIVQCAYVPVHIWQFTQNHVGDKVRQESAALLQAVQNLPGPVLSDDLAVLRLAGKPVEIEPYIFAELGTAGYWNEQPLIDMLNQHAFSGVVTDRGPGAKVFTDRFLPRTIEAMLRNYPHDIKFGDNHLRLPD